MCCAPGRIQREGSGGVFWAERHDDQFLGQPLRAEDAKPPVSYLAYVGMNFVAENATHEASAERIAKLGGTRSS